MSRRPVVLLLAVACATALASPSAAGAATGAADVPATPVRVADGGDATLSATGRFLAHVVSSTGPDGRVNTRLVHRDLVTGERQILNRTVAGAVAGGTYGRPPLVSDSGRRVTFTSSASRLVAGDTNGRSDAFVREVPTGATSLASTSATGGPSNGQVGSAAMSRSGRWVVFVSTGTDVVPGSTTTNADVFRRDLLTGATRQVTLRPDGTPSRGPGASSADVSGDGRLVAYTSYNTDLAPADGADGEPDLFVTDLATGTTRWLGAGFPAGAQPFAVVLSPDGSTVSTRWADGSLHLTDVASAATTTVAAEGFAQPGAFASDGGRFVYASAGSAWLRDLTTGQDRRLPGVAGGSVVSVALSGDGRTAALSWVSDDGTSSRVYTLAV